MSDFKTKMPKNRFPLWLRPKTDWGSLQRSPDPLAVFKELASKGREGKEERRKKWREGERKRREREDDGKGGKGRGQPPQNILA